MPPPDPQMRNPAAANGRAKSQADFNAAKNATVAGAFQEKPTAQESEFALGLIKSAVLRLDEIRQELINAGVALKANYITPQMAIDWAEEFAPGCIGYVPPNTRLRVSRQEAAA
jgi:hypothetical protein